MMLPPPVWHLSRQQQQMSDIPDQKKLPKRGQSVSEHAQTRDTKDHSKKRAVRGQDRDSNHPTEAETSDTRTK